VKIAEKVVEIAGKLGVPPAQIALNWLCQQGSNVIPIVGARRVEQLADSLGCIDFVIPEEDMKALDDVSRIEKEFPYSFYDSANDVIFGGTQATILK
jgi:aryl-alcohol dehydrogenase-like predicted oxidoreductase